MKKLAKLLTTAVLMMVLYFSCTTKVEAKQQFSLSSTNNLVTVNKATVKAGWKKSNGKWWYQNANGTYPKNQWKKISGKYYYFDKNGYMVTNKWIGNYYVQSNGVMATNKWIGNYYVDATGKWVKTKTAPKTASATATKTTGTKVGSINIARVGYSMPLYTGKQSQYQEIVDNENSALYVNSFFGGNGMIADHAAQGLKKQKSCVKGDTMTLTVNGKTTKYVMTSIYTNGQNVGNGIKIGNKYADEMTDGSLFIYCCNDSTGKSVTVTFWKKA